MNGESYSEGGAFTHAAVYSDDNIFCSRDDNSA